ncbi:redoxin domain-containing protein [Chitinophaga sp. SYP-B3965]|uniref:TlpA disulfide reductase family protein n=1 Tax=Chitinophaga sp. SYP-B3965 TaxID=2663120 RepID=UPI00129969C9|nr:TlpA disulfide reductase family protein [Chitinophaga sp. SYP-B3965]MRG43782.1 redoxin domain-containing protein [Chitinophaga sp. SYP-B3965]
MSIYLSALLLYFSVQGTIDPVHNGKYIYLYGIDYSRVNPKITDSCLITDGRFHFEGQLVTPGVLVSLYMKSPRDIFSQFILENRNITVSIKPGDCIVENSPLTEQWKARKKITDPISTESYFTQMAMDSLKKRYDTLRQKTMNVDKDHIRSHPGDYLSLYLLRYWVFNDLTKQKDTLLQLYNGLTPALKQLEEAKLLKTQIDVLYALQPGMLAPAFSAPDPKGAAIHLSDFKGKYVLIDFWASWCGPCLESIPEMKKTYAQYKDKQLEVLGVSLDDKQKAWKDALAKYDLPWVNISELKGWDGEIGKQYNIRSIPQNVLIGKDGRILGVDINLAKDLPNLIK